MSKNKIIIIAVVLVVIVVIAVVFLLHPGSPASTPVASTGTTAQSTTASSPNAVDATRALVPVNIIVPGVGQAVASSVAPPQVVAPANSHTTSEYRSFNIKADDNEFTPSTIIVNQGDIVNIVITAVDKAYDFTQPDYGFKQPIPAGQSKTIQFGATAAGKFTFYCSSCGGPAKGPVGYIIVAAPQ